MGRSGGVREALLLQVELPGLFLTDPHYRLSEALEANWDPAKHPRGGQPQNRGWFSNVPGSSASTASHTVGQKQSAPADALLHREIATPSDPNSDANARQRAGKPERANAAAQRMPANPAASQAALVSFQGGGKNGPAAPVQQWYDMVDGELKPRDIKEVDRWSDGKPRPGAWGYTSVDPDKAKFKVVVARPQGPGESWGLQVTQVYAGIDSEVLKGRLDAASIKANKDHEWVHVKAYFDITAAFARLAADLDKYIASLPPDQQQAAAEKAANAVNSVAATYHRELLIIEDLRQFAHADQLDNRKLIRRSRPIDHLDEAGPTYREILKDPDFQRKFLALVRARYNKFPANGTTEQALDFLKQKRNDYLSKLDAVYKQVTGKDRPKP